MRVLKRRMLMAATLGALATCGMGVAQAQEAWPARAVRLVVPYPAGGGTDFAARLIAERLSASLGREVIVENKTGASGSIGAQAVAQSTPDGYTVLFASPAEVLVSRIAGQKTSYDPDKDLEPVTLAGELPLAIVVNPASGIDSVEALLAASKKQGAALSYGTPGTGSSMQFAGEQLNLASGGKILHVPYRGAAPAVADLLGNQIPAAVVGLQPVLAAHRAGKLKVIAVTGEKRTAVLPDVPAVAELSGFAGYRFTNWFGVYVPHGTPRPVIDKLADAFHAALSTPELRKKLEEQGIEPIGNSTVQFRQFLAAEKARYTKVQKESGITVN
ncbi:tripartite tricarboxylate transporter substrate binding protein [Pusillimonas sp. TS35]|uniref:Bug family tripartite tricarboxylate transporter substrate binding protein n=1 Tax=Paracandidimonas lactea TaxID=2895524 RepID=UPI001367FFD5|nr:tripartite tricarboxylate transporter substrate binding protein [Paracandidimonas lactea]MYN13742.1 tripartite tricarboxylate transporter substrate binding protein [Pusillimonas sp. TS35]